MADVDKLAADFAQYQSDVGKQFDALKAQLATALGAGGIPADVQAKLDALDAVITGADASLTTPPAPTTPPAA